MKILHINCNYIGTTLHQKMIEALDATGIESNIFVPTYDRNIAVININSNVVISECFNKYDRICFDYKQARIFKAIQRDMNLSFFDCIHAYTLFTDGNCAMRLSKKYGIPYVVAVRNTDVNTFFKKMPLLRKRGIEIMKNASAIFFLSESYKQQVFDRYVSQDERETLLEKVSIIPNGIDDFWFSNSVFDRNLHKSRLERNEIKIIYAGRIDKNKNIPTTQRAIKELQERGYKTQLTIVGKIDDKREFDRISNDQNTVYVTAQPKEKLAALYREQDVFVMPSFTESFGLVYAEAMSQGLPVVYSKGQGFDGQFPEGEVGLHVDPSDSKQVCSAIIEIVKKYDEFYDRCIQGSKKFNWDVLVNEYIKVYQTLCP